MTRICREDISHSFFLSFPPSLEHDFFHHPFHQQTPPLNHPSPPPPSPPPVDGIGANLVPRNTNTTTTQNSPSVDTLRPFAGTLAGDTSSGEGSSMDLPLTLFEDIDLGLLSCTESLGFESSDEISTLGFGSGAGFSCSTATSYSSNAEDHESSCSSSSSSSSWTTPFCSTSYCSTSTRRWSEKREFPPPLTTMRGNGGRNFMLRSERKDGRLEIVKVEIERPEVLYASRQNGRLTMHLVRSFPEYDEQEEEEEEEEEEEDVVCEEEEEEEEQENDAVLEEEKEQEEVKEEEEEEKAEDDESETEEEEEEAEEKEEEEEEIEWKNIPAAAVRRCYQYHQQHAWGHHHQRRWVTTM